MYLILFVFIIYLERLHLEQQGAVKTKCWRRNKAQKNSPEPKSASSRRLTSNALLDSLSMLDLPTSSTSDSMPSSSTSPVLPDVNIRVPQEVTSLENVVQPQKAFRNINNPKSSIQTSMQSFDNPVELNLDCPTLSIDQNTSETSQLFTMPVSNNTLTVTSSNSSTITASKIASQSIVSNISSQPIVSNMSNQSVSTNVTSKSATNNIVSSNPSQSFASNIISQSIANSMISQSIANSLISQSMTNTNLKVVSTQAGVNSGLMINISPSISSNNQTQYVNNNKVVVSNISSNVSLLFMFFFSIIF